MLIFPIPSTDEEKEQRGVKEETYTSNKENTKEACNCQNQIALSTDLIVLVFSG